MNTTGKLHERPPRRKPLVSLALFSYNQEKFIEEAVEGALSQDYSPLEIIFSDDCSQDRTFELIKAATSRYQGCHSIVLNRNEANMGVAGHFSSIIERSRGEFVVIAAGDDISLSQRASRSVEPLIADPSLSFCEVGFREFFDSAVESTVIRPNSRDCNDSSSETVTLSRFTSGDSQGLIGAARTIRKSFYLQFPPLGASCPSEDTPSILRLLMMGNGIKIGAVGLERRIHESNLSNPSSIAKMDFGEIERQYVEDINTALTLGSITAEDQTRLVNWAHRSMWKRRLLQHIQTGNTLNFSHLTRTLRSRVISPKEKIWYLRHFFRSHWN